YRHFQTLIQDPANIARFRNTDAGRATGQGFEVLVRGNLHAALGAFATYGYTDATFDETGDNGEPQRFAGSTFRLTARHMAALGLALEWPATGVGRFTVSPSWQYTSPRFFDDDNTRLGGTLRQPGFGLVNLRVAWQSPRQRWAAAVQARNLLDREYLIDGGNIGANFGLPTFVRGEPRRIAAEITRRF